MTQLPRELENIRMRAELHDSHNIEIKTQMNIAKLNQEAHLEVYVFVPSSFEAKHLSKSHIFEDIRSKMRFTVQDSTQTHDHVLLLGLERIQACLETQPVNSDHLLKHIQSLANVINEKYKSILETLNIEELVFMYGLIEKTRFHFKEQDIFQSYKLISLFDEFISQNLIQLIISLEKKDILSDALTDLKMKEVCYRELNGYNITSSSSDEDLEKKLTRMSQLKKFFQATSFIDIQRVDYFKRLRGIIKFFDKTLSNFIHINSPDYFSKLAINQKPFGKASEWVQVCNNKNLEADVFEKRQRFTDNKIESLASEDVISYKKKIKIYSNPKLPVNLNNFKFLQDTVRINFERYLKLMDDPIKEFLEVDNGGAIMKFQSQKVYNVYVHTRVQFIKKEKRDLKTTEAEEHTYRIVLNKNGIVRVENIQIN